MQSKYQFTDETKTLDDGVVLHRIEALRAGPWGPAGTRGGWIQSEGNLSHRGNCWVSENAKVSDNALIYENAEVYGNVQISEKANVSGEAIISANAKVSGNQKVNGYCWLNGKEEGLKFQVNNTCVCDYEIDYLEKYHGCFWIISAAYKGWVQAKHGPEEVAFRNNWLRKV